MFGRELPFTVLAKPYLPDSHRLGHSKTLLLAVMTTTEGTGRRSSSWHKYHLYETLKRLLYIKLSIPEIVSDAP